MRFCNRRWFVDVVYNAYIGRPAMEWGYRTSFRAIDRGILEILGPQGLSQASVSLAQRLRSLQSGYMYHYALVMLFRGYSINCFSCCISRVWYES